MQNSSSVPLYKLSDIGVPIGTSAHERGGGEKGELYVPSGLESLSTAACCQFTFVRMKCAHLHFNIPHIRILFSADFNPGASIFRVSCDCNVIRKWWVVSLFPELYPTQILTACVTGSKSSNSLHSTCFTSTLQMDAILSSWKLVTTCKSTRHHNQKDHNWHLYSPENISLTYTISPCSFLFSQNLHQL